MAMRGSTDRGKHTSPTLWYQMFAAMGWAEEGAWLAPAYPLHSGCSVGAWLAQAFKRRYSDFVAVDAKNKPNNTIRCAC